MLPIQLRRRRRLKRRAKRLGSYAAASRALRSAFSAFVSFPLPSGFSNMLPAGRVAARAVVKAAPQQPPKIVARLTNQGMQALAKVSRISTRTQLVTGTCSKTARDVPQGYLVCVAQKHCQTHQRMGASGSVLHAVTLLGVRSLHLVQKVY
jgi:hypothetical protein